MTDKKRSSKPSGELRQSQLLTTFGPGSMVDLPTRSVVISGLTYWKGERQFIREDRLRYKVWKSLGLLDGQDIQLYTPPQQSNDPQAAMTGVDAFIFPGWFLAQVDKTTASCCTREPLVLKELWVGWSRLVGTLSII